MNRPVDPPTQLTYTRIAAFWLPLAGTWLMMAVEGPYLAAIIARLEAPAINLAAFGVAFAFAIIIESSVIMLMTTSTALVEDRESYLALRRFSYGLGTLLTLVQLIILAPPIFGFFASLLSLPSEVATLAHGGLAIMLPWPAAIAYRRFSQGLLIRSGFTRRVAYGTVVRLVTMSVTAWIVYQRSDLSGALIGALALSAGVVAEAVVSRLMTSGVAQSVLRRHRDAGRLDSLRLGAVVSFYAPLALTSFLVLASQPTVTFFMGQSRFPIESLAVLPVIYGLTFIFRSLGLSYLEVVITLIGREREHVAMVRNFSVGLGLFTASGLGLIAFTPLAWVWFHDVSGLSRELTEFALIPIRILAILPGLSVLLAFERGLLVHARRNTSITWATLVELVSLAVILAVCIHLLDLIGAVAAAVAILSGRIASTGLMLPTCLAVLRGDPPLDPEVVAPPAPETT